MNRSVTVAAVLWIAASSPLPSRAAADGPAATLAFSDFFRRPIGPRGLEPTPRLLSLSGSLVRLRGFVVRNADGADSAVIVAPVPVTLGDEDESLADDLPAAIAYLHGMAETAAALRHCKGPIEAVGLLETGARRESDARYSMVRIALQSARCAG